MSGATSPEKFGGNTSTHYDVTHVSEARETQLSPRQQGDVGKNHATPDSHLPPFVGRTGSDVDNTVAYSGPLNPRYTDSGKAKDPFSIYFTQNSTDGILPEVVKQFDATTGSTTSETTSDSDSEAASQSRQFCWGLCCVQGCVWGVIAGLYFFLLLPTSFLLIVFGSNQSLPWATATGSLLLVVATCGIPGVALLFRWMRRRRRDRQRAYRQQKDADAARATFDNPTEVADDEAVLDAV